MIITASQKIIQAILVCGTSRHEASSGEQDLHQALQQHIRGWLHRWWRIHRRQWGRRRWRWRRVSWRIRWWSVGRLPQASADPASKPLLPHILLTEGANRGQIEPHLRNI